jgi:hypothetical protein
MALSLNTRENNGALTVIEDREQIFHTNVFIRWLTHCRRRLGVNRQNLIRVANFANQSSTSCMPMPINQDVRHDSLDVCRMWVQYGWCRDEFQQSVLGDILAVFVRKPYMDRGNTPNDANNSLAQGKGSVGAHGCG